MDTVIISLAVLVLAIAADQLLGEYPHAVHPVVWIGSWIQTTLKAAPRQGWWAQFLFGGVLALGTVVLCVRLSLWMLVLAGPYPAIEILVGAYLLKASFALRELGAAAQCVQEPLAKGDLATARARLSALCSRDPAQLDSEAVAAGVVESVAENASDSVVAPLFYFALFGVAGAVGYRAINTLDAMIGYRGRFEALGKCAARLDDVANWLPARLTALLLLMAGWLLRANVRAGWRILRRDGGTTPSPNGGRPMAAMAGLLGVRLEKAGVYALGDAGEKLTAVTIARACRLMKAACCLMIGLTVALRYFVA